MAVMSDYLQDAIVNHVLTNTSYTSPSPVYVALYTSDPMADDTGTELAPGVDGYNRVSVVFTFMGPGTGQVQSSAVINFGPCNTNNWGTITHLGIKDAATGPNLLFYGPLAAAKTINVGDTFTILANQITVTVE